MDELARVREEIRRGDHSSAEAILDAILDGPEPITSHLLFDITSAFEELFSATGRYEDLIRTCHRCAEKARRLLAAVDAQIHSANTLTIIAGAERTLGRRNDAERDAHAAERLLGQFAGGHFGPSSRERVNRLWVRLKSVQRSLIENDLSSPSRGPAANPPR